MYVRLLIIIITSGCSVALHTPTVAIDALLKCLSSASSVSTQCSLIADSLYVVTLNLHTEDGMDWPEGGATITGLIDIISCNLSETSECLQLPEAAMGLRGGADLFTRYGLAQGEPASLTGEEMFMIICIAATKHTITHTHVF